MKAEFTLSEEFVDQIVDRLFNKIKPLFANNNRIDDNIILDVKGLSEYLHVSDKWIYKKTHLKEIPYLKIDGQLRFRKRDIDKWISGFNVPVTHSPTGKLNVIKRK